MELERARTWEEVSLSALENNYRTLRATLPEGCRFLGVVKADAYGHGAVPIARKLVQLGSEMLAVACLSEALELHEARLGRPILILGLTPDCFADQVVEKGFVQSVFTPELAQALSQAALQQGRTARIHVKLDTGMSRMGVSAWDARECARQVEQICTLPGLEPEGIFTHFANADGDEDYTMLQFTRFLEVLELLEKTYGRKFAIRHCAASGATINYPCTHMDMVRPGLALYGYYPEPYMRQVLPGQLRPVMTLCTRVAAVRTLPAGTAVSYGCTRVLDRDTRVALLPVGYADGLIRLLSNRLEVELKGGRAAVLGRICMDMCMVDITDLDGVSVGDVATICGPDKPMEEATEAASTIQQEMLCGISKRVPRVYTE